MYLMFLIRKNYFTYYLERIFKVKLGVHHEHLTICTHIIYDILG